MKWLKNYTFFGGKGFWVFYDNGTEPFDVRRQFENFGADSEPPFYIDDDYDVKGDYKLFKVYKGFEGHGSPPSTSENLSGKKNGEWLKIEL